MYQVVITKQDEGTTHEFLATKRAVVRFIAQETGASQKSFADEISTRQNSSFNRDSAGFRVEIFYNTK